MDHQAAYLAAFDAFNELVAPLRKIGRGSAAPEVANVAAKLKIKLERAGALTPNFSDWLDAALTEVAMAQKARKAGQIGDARAGMIRALDKVNAVANALIKRGPEGAEEFREE